MDLFVGSGDFSGAFGVRALTKMDACVFNFRASSMSKRLLDEELQFPPLLPSADWERLSAERGLTRRESEVAAMLCRAAGYAAIQTHLRVARPTLRSHLRAIYRKFGCRNRTELILRIVHDGLLTSEAAKPGKPKKSRRSHP